MDERSVTHRSRQGNRVKGESSSFLKKRTKKLLRLGARLASESATANKSFLLLFFKKEDLSIACLPSPDCPIALDARNLMGDASLTLPTKLSRTYDQSGSEEAKVFLVLFCNCPPA
jgi:hypothetical protein